MKVIALGGTGGMGRYAARTAAGFDFVEKVVIADRDGPAAERFAAEIGDKAESAVVDVQDTARLQEVVARGDVVLNTVGPFFRFGVPILKAVIGTGRHYLDICDDWEPTLEMLALKDEARRSGVTAVIGLGASPGITNLMAVLAIRELDRADDVYTVWDLDSAKPEKIGPEPSAAMVHGMLQLTGSIRVWENGAPADVKPVRRVMIDYPGIGRRPAWSIGHPEALTLPRTFPDLRVSRNLMVTSRTNVAALRVMGALVDAGWVSLERAARVAEKVEGTGVGRTPEDFVREVRKGGRLPLPPLFALAEGVKDGARAAAAVAVLGAPPGGMGGATGVPLAAGLTLFHGRTPAPGVYAPEGIVEPEPFLDVLAPLCESSAGGAGSLLLVTRSWEAGTDLRSLLQASG